MEMTKKILDVILIDESHPTEYQWKDMKRILDENEVVLQDDDYIVTGFQEGHSSENNSWDIHYNFQVVRQIEETDEQLNVRILREELRKENWRQKRYQDYLNLKKEFEN